MKEFLKDTFQHCMDMQKLAETKNAGLLAFNGAVIFTSSKYAFEPDLHYVLRLYCVYVTLCALMSVFLNLSAISAQIKHKELEQQNHAIDNLQFFGTIANYAPAKYLSAVNSEYFNSNETISTYHHHLAAQIVINAQIALRKFKLFNTAFKWTICALTTPIGVVVFIAFYNNNR